MMASPIFEGSDIHMDTVCCIGAGYVGGSTSAVLALKNPFTTVNVVDLDREKIGAWNSNSLPIAEPGFLSIVRISRDGTDGRKPNLFFSTDVNTAIHKAHTIFIAINTPTSTRPDSKGALDTTYVESAIENIARISIHNKLLVIKSTVPPGAIHRLKQILDNHRRSDVYFIILCNPEFLAEGTAVQDLLNPDRVLIGSGHDEQALIAARWLGRLYEAWVPKERIIRMSIQSAELAKLASNVLLAQRISSINALSIICEEAGADIDEVARACGLDHRLGPHMLQASLGFGGSCLKKDVLALAALSDSLGVTYSQIARYWRSINDINELRRSRFVMEIVDYFNGVMRGKKIAVLGFAFKKGTGDVRESPAIHVVDTLIWHGAGVAVYDPQAKTDDINEALAGVTKQPVRQGSFEVCNTAYEACEGAYAVIIATDWEEFGDRESIATIPDSEGAANEMEVASKAAQKTSLVQTEDGKSTVMTTADTGARREEDSMPKKINWRIVANGMTGSKVVFDGGNVVDGEKLSSMGLTVVGIGKAPLTSTLCG